MTTSTRTYGHNFLLLLYYRYSELGEKRVDGCHRTDGSWGIDPSCLRVSIENARTLRCQAEAGNTDYILKRAREHRLPQLKKYREYVRAKMEETQN